jgi:hypothetical protein
LRHIDDVFLGLDIVQECERRQAGCNTHYADFPFEMQGGLAVAAIQTMI